MSAPNPLPAATSERSAEPTPATVGAETMKAIVQDEYGTAPEEVLRLEEIARPEIGDDEILVRVRAASVDRGTWHLMTGLAYPIRLAGFGLRRPKALNPGRSLAGTVESAGQEVTGFGPGDEVVRHRRRLLRPVRPRPGEQARAQAREPLLRAGGGRPRLRADRAAGRARPREGAGRAEGADHRRFGRGGHVRRPDRQGLRSRGHRRVQHGEDGSGPLHRSRPRDRLHPRRLRRRAAPVRRNPRHRRQPSAVPPPPGPHRPRQARHRREARTVGGGSAVPTASSAPFCYPRW